MKKQIIAITILVLVAIVLIGNIGADKRALIGALEHQGYEKAADGVYRMREIQETETGLIMIDRSFDVKNNHGESHVTTLFRRLDDKMVKESEVIELSYWDFDSRHFEPVN